MSTLHAPAVSDVVAPPPGAADVLTHHGNARRTGASLAETSLNPGNVRAPTFGRLYERSVDNHIYAQPLYVEGVDVTDDGGVLHPAANVVLVATMGNTVYLFDADATSPDPTGGLLWRRTLGPPGPVGSDVDSSHGILATPVVDKASNTIYVVARLDDGPTHPQKLYALDLRNGLERKSVAISGSVAVASLDAGAGAGDSSVVFDPTWQYSRPGLLLRDGIVYIAFGSHGDIGDYHGWIMGYDATTLLQRAIYCTTPHARSGGGIWQAGNGLAADDDGYLYVMTGNNTYANGDPGPAPVDQENSFVRLRLPDLVPVGQLTPATFSFMERNDVDLGSSGPMIIPDTDRAVGAGKPGRMYVLNRKTMKAEQEFQAFFNTWRLTGPTKCTDTHPKPSDPCWISPEDYDKNDEWGPHLHGAPVYWRSPNADYGLIYAWSEKDYLKAFKYRIATGRIDEVDVVKGSIRGGKDSMPGGALSISADGTRAGSGILWASVQEPFDACPEPNPTCSVGHDPTVPGRIYAYDAETLAMLWEDKIEQFAKFTPPTIARGRVYLATHMNALYVYGLKP